jgi:hypothetical protein
MIEKTVRDYLESALDAPVYVEMPRSRPKRFCLVQQTGGGAKDRLRTAMVAVQSYGASRYEAALLNEDVITALHGLPTLTEIAACRLNASYPFPDTEVQKNRFQAVFDVVYYQ